MAEQAQKVGGRIAELREARGWSRPQLARALPGVSTGNDVYRWENGKHLPRSDTLDAIADLFEVSVADLYAGPIADRANGETPDLLAALSPGSSSSEVLAAIATLAERVGQVQLGVERLARQVEALSRRQLPEAGNEEQE